MNLENNYFSLNASESVFSNNNGNVRNCVQKQNDHVLTLDRGAVVARTSPLRHHDCVFVTPSNSSIVNIKSIVKTQENIHSRMTTMKKTKPILLDQDGAEKMSLRSCTSQEEPKQEPFDSPAVEQRQLPVEGQEEADEKMEDNVDTTTIRYEYVGYDHAEKNETAAVVVAGHVSIVSTTDSEKQDLSVGVKLRNNLESSSSGICDTTVVSVKKQARTDSIEGRTCTPTTTSQNCGTGTNRTWKKPVGKPKRPLSAYNLFFQLERKRFISSSGVDDPHFTQDDIDSLTNTRTVKKRCNRKTHGLIAFGDLARHIGTKWKTLDKETKQLFEVRAHDEKVRYQNEIRAWLLQKEQQPTQEEESNKKTARTSGTSTKETDEQDKDYSTATTAVKHSVNEERVTSSLLPSRFVFDIECNIKPKRIHSLSFAGTNSHSTSSPYRSTTCSKKKNDPSTTSSDCTRRLLPTTKSRRGQVQAGVTEDYDRDHKEYIDANTTTFLRWINDTTESVDDGYRITSYEKNTPDYHLDPSDGNLDNHQESLSFDIRATDTRDRKQSNGMESDDNRNDHFFEMYLQQQRENDAVQYHPRYPNIHYDDHDYEMESLKHCIQQQQEEMGQLQRYMHQQQQFNLFQAARATNAQSQYQQQGCPTVQQETYYDGSLCDTKNTDSIDLYHHRRDDSCFSMYMDYNHNEDISSDEQHDDVYLQNDNDTVLQRRLVMTKKDGIDLEHNSEPFLSISSIPNLKAGDCFHHSYNDLLSYHQSTEQNVFGQQQEQQRQDEHRFQQKFQHRTDPNIHHTHPTYDLTDDTTAVDHHLHKHGSTITCRSRTTDNFFLQSTKRASVVNHQEEMYVHRVKKGTQAQRQLLSPSSSRSTLSQSSSLNNDSRSRTMSFPPMKFPQDVVEVTTNRTNHRPGEVSYYKNTDTKDICHHYASPMMTNNQYANIMYKPQIQRQQLQQQRRRRLRMMMMMQRMSTNDDIDLCNSNTTTSARSYNDDQHQQRPQQHEEGEDRDRVSAAPLPPPLLLHNTTEYENQQQHHQPISVSRRMSNKFMKGRAYPDSTYLMTTTTGSSARNSIPDPNTTLQQQQQQLQLLPVDNMDGNHDPISITVAAAANENHSQQQRHEHVSTMIHDNSNDSMTGYEYEYNY